MSGTSFMIFVAIVAAAGVFIYCNSLRKQEKQELKRLEKTLFTL